MAEMADISHSRRKSSRRSQKRKGEANRQLVSETIVNANKHGRGRCTSTRLVLPLLSVAVSRFGPRDRVRTGPQSSGFASRCLGCMAQGDF